MTTKDEVKFGVGDRVVVNHLGDAETTGVVEGVEHNMVVTTPKVHVRIDKPGHKEHGRVVVLGQDAVKDEKPKETKAREKEEKKDAKDEAKQTAINAGEISA
jgi:hypothetical protein